MDLNELFKIQAKLDERIIHEHGLEGRDLLDKKILALQVELGELANEWRGFKFWSDDQEPRTYEANPDDVCEACKGNPIYYNEDKTKIVDMCGNCDGCGVRFHNPLLEEYVDCLHFILSIGNDRYIEEHEFSDLRCETNVTECFLKVFDSINDLHEEINFGNSYDSEDKYIYLVEDFILLGDALGFTREQIEQAYFDKNKINHERQNTGY